MKSAPLLLLLAGCNSGGRDSLDLDCVASATVVVDGGDSLDSCFLHEQGVTA